MTWNILGGSPEQQIRFQKPFIEKYTLTQVSDMTLGSMVIQTTTEIRWELKLLLINSSSYNIELNTINTTLVATNNANLRQLSALNNAFKKMFNEVELEISLKGELLKINNLGLIRKKWEQVKRDMDAAQSKFHNLQKMIDAQDAIFSSDQSIMDAIRNDEFFLCYLHKFMGIKPPSQVTSVNKSLFMQNEYRIDYNFQLNSSLPTYSSDYQLAFDSSAYGIDGVEWKKKAYSGLPFLDDVKVLKPTIREKGNYLFDTQTGKLLLGTFSRQETAHPEFLKGTITYSLKADSYNEVRK